MPVPEQRHLLFERPGGVEHAFGPPVAHAASLQLGRTQPVEEAIGDRLHVAVDMVGFDPNAHALALLDRQVSGGRSARREMHQRLVPETRMPERRQVVIRDVVVVDEGTDRLLGRHVRQLPDLFWSAAEARAAKQMGGPVVAPVPEGDRGQIPRPCGRPRRPTLQGDRNGVTGDGERQNGASHRRVTVASSRHGLDSLISGPVLGSGPFLHPASGSSVPCVQIGSFIHRYPPACQRMLATSFVLHSHPLHHAYATRW